ncbi:MAG: autotransporter-associated beta strand repeat-containing protein, partial [Verrucomicrobiota bacterium]
MKTMHIQSWLTALTLWFCVPAGLSIAANVTLQQGVNGYTSTTDSWLDESAHTDNYGGATYVRVQYNNGMSDSTVIRFGLPVLTFQNVAGATLGLDYYDYYSMVADNALWITPYRISPGMSWFENIYNGTAGHGVSWYYRDDSESLSWTSQYGAWYDKIDDGNSMAKIKRPGGSVTNAIAPTNWVTWSVVNSVSNWYEGRENDGFVLFESGFEGSGSILAGLFYSRDFGTAANRPYLNITYQGAQIPWTGAANATWDTSALNWNVGGYAGTYGNGDFVTFADGASNPAITVTDGGVLPGSVTITNNSTTYSFSGGSIGGSAALTKSGSGSATLGAANDYSGPTLIKGSLLIVSANNALGATGGGTVVSNGAALGFQSVTYSSAEPVTISGTGVSNSGALYAASGVSTFAGSVTMAASSSVGVVSGLYLTLNGAISGGFDLTKSGAGWLTLGGTSSNTYGGTTYVNEGTLALAKSTGNAVPNDLFIGDGTHAATCRLGAEGQLASGCDVTVRDASLLDLNNHSANIGNLTLTNGAASSGAGTLGLGGNVASSGNLIATISGRLNLGGAEREFHVANGTATDDLVVSAAIASGAILKTGSGRLVLGGNNTFDGLTTISNGVIAISYGTALGSTVGGTIVADGARLELESNIVVGAESLTLNGSGGGLGALRNFSDTNSWAGDITLASSAMIESDPGQLTLNSSIAGVGFGLSFNTTGDIIANGAITGTGTTVTKYSAGTLTFGGSHPNTYSGTTYVDMGTLTLAKSSGPAVPGELVVGDHADAATVLFSGPGQLTSAC